MPTRILIADDNFIFRKTLRQLLESVNQWEVIEACDGQEAVSKSADLQPNVVVLDLAMPIKDGLTAAREISQLLPDTPILMCTMHMGPHLELEAKKSGVRCILSKTESSLLVSTVHNVTAHQPVPETPALDLPLSSAPAPTELSSALQPTEAPGHAEPDLPSSLAGEVKDVS